MVGIMNSADAIKRCIDAKKNFLLQGGAGSGKTETLKETLEYVLTKYPAARLACITHTNLAAAEIRSRVDTGDSHISTIHSFLSELVGPYKKSIQTVIHELFIVPNIIRGIGKAGDPEYKKAEHEKYKKLHNRYSSTNFSLRKEASPKAIGKRAYDTAPEDYNRRLNEQINALNGLIKKKISETDYRSIYYNETRFDDLKDLSYGHNGLLTIASLLFKNYPVLGKILEDRFDFIFIDEYQDTNEKVIELFLERLPGHKRLVVGLFGDSMQAIYEDGIGDVDAYVANGALERIQKEDNFRCSEQVLDLINKLRSDELRQELAFRKKPNGERETRAERQGTSKLFYSVCETKPNSHSPDEDKSNYTERLDKLIGAAVDGLNNFKTLMLTNKSIAVKAGFANLYDIYSKRYVEPREYINRDLERLQLLDLYQLMDSFSKKHYDPILTFLRKHGFFIKKLDDKVEISDRIRKVVEADASLFDSIEMAVTLGLLKRSSAHSSFNERRSEFLKYCDSSKDFLEFKARYRDGNHTHAKMLKVEPGLDEELFNEREREVKKQAFLLDLFSARIKFSEVINYIKYENEDLGHMTMHKTKGSSIDNVVVVLDEYLWSEYNFGSIFQPSGSEVNDVVKSKSQKLMYVACSRARVNLRCVRLISPEEEPQLKAYFEEVVRV